MDTFSSLFRNTFFSMFTNILNRVGNTLLFIFVIQQIGIDAGGIYNLAFAYFFIGSRFAFWGLDHLLTREVSKRPETANQYLNNFLFVRVVLGLIVVIIFSIIVVFIGYDLDVTLVIIIFLIGIIPENINNLCWSSYAAFEEFHLSGIGSLVNIFFKLGLGIFLVRSGASLIIIALVILVGGFITMFINLGIVHRRYITKWEKPDFHFLKPQLQIAVPFLFIGMFFILDNRLDNILLSFLSTKESIGIYGTATAIILALNLIPEGYRIAILPVMSRHQEKADFSLNHLYANSLKFLLAIGIPLCVATILLADKLISLIYKKDLPTASLSLQIMSLALAFMFINVLNNRLLIVHNRQNLIAKSLIITTVINIIINLILIPKWGAIGASVARVISIVLLFILTTIVTKKHVPDVNRLHHLWQLGLSAFVMGLIIICLNEWGIWVQTAGGSIAYVIMLFVTGIITYTELDYLCQLFQKNRFAHRKSNHASEL